MACGTRRRRRFICRNCRIVRRTIGGRVRHIFECRSCRRIRRRRREEVVEREVDIETR